MVIWEITVDFAKQRDHLAAHGFNEFWRELSATPLPQSTATFNGRDMSSLPVPRLCTERINLFRKRALWHYSDRCFAVVGKLLNQLFGEVTPNHHFQAVVFRRIVAAGNHDAGAGFKRVCCKVKNRGGYLPH